MLSSSRNKLILCLIIILVILLGINLWSKRGPKPEEFLAQFAPMVTIKYERFESGFLSHDVTFHNVEVNRKQPDGSEPLVVKMRLLTFEGVNADMLAGGERLLAKSVIAEDLQAEEMDIKHLRIDGLRNDWRALIALYADNAKDNPPAGATGAAIALQELMGASDLIEATGVSAKDYDGSEPMTCARALITKNGPGLTERILVENLKIDESSFGTIELLNWRSLDKDALAKLAEESDDYYNVYYSGLEPQTIDTLKLADADFNADSDAAENLSYWMPATFKPDMCKNIDLKNVKLTGEGGTVSLGLNSLTLTDIGDFSLGKGLLEGLSIKVKNTATVTVESFLLTDFQIPENIRKEFNRAFFGSWDDDDEPDFWDEDGEFDEDAYEEYMRNRQESMFENIFDPTFSLCELRKVKADFMGQYVYLDLLKSTVESKEEITSTSVIEGLRISGGIFGLAAPRASKALGYKELEISHNLVGRTTDKKSRVLFEGTIFDLKDGGILKMAGEFKNLAGKAIDAKGGMRDLAMIGASVTYEDKSLAGRILRAIAAEDRETPEEFLADLLREVDRLTEDHGYNDDDWDDEDNWDDEDEEDFPSPAPAPEPERPAFTPDPLKVEFQAALRAFLEKPGIFTLKIAPKDPLLLMEMEQTLRHGPEPLGLSFKTEQGAKSILEKP